MYSDGSEGLTFASVLSSSGRVLSSSGRTLGSAEFVALLFSLALCVIVCYALMLSIALLICYVALCFSVLTLVVICDASQSVAMSLVIARQVCCGLI